MKRKVLIILTGMIIACIAILLTIGSFYFAHIWKHSAQFKKYENEFVLVKDYVGKHMNGDNGALLLSRTESHYYDLYDIKTNQYLDCPINVRSALRIISEKAFSRDDAYLDCIRHEENMISFEIENGPYRLVYSPNKEPTIKSYLDSYVVLKKRIVNDWYHVTILSW